MTDRVTADHIIASRKEVWALRDRVKELEADLRKAYLPVVADGGQIAVISTAHTGGEMTPAEHAATVRHWLPDAGRSGHRASNRALDALQAQAEDWEKRCKLEYQTRMDTKAMLEAAEAERDRLAKQLSRAHDDESIERERAEKLAAQLRQVEVLHHERVEELEAALDTITALAGNQEAKRIARAALDKEKA